MPFIVLNEGAATVIPTSGLGVPLVSTGETLLSMDTELDASMGVRADITPVRRRSWINQAYVDVASSLEISDLAGSFGFSLVAGQALYKLPIEVGATRGKYGVSVIDTATYGTLGGRALLKTDLEAYRVHGDLTEEPREYFRQRSLLVVWPTPLNIRALAIDFWIVPQYLVNDTDSPILSLEWHEAILLKARAKAFARVQNFDKAQQAENDFVSFVRRRVGRDEKEDSGRLITSSVPRRRSQLWRRWGWPSTDSPRELDGL